MNREDIIRMAREAGIIHPEMVDKTLERFAELVASAERERFCAVLRQWHDTYSLLSDPSTIREKYKYGTPLLDAFTKEKP